MDRNLIAALQRLQGSRKGIRFIEGRDDEVFVTYDELYTRARRALARLREHGARAGDSAIVTTRANESFVSIFWACLLGRITAIPLLYPTNDDQRLRLANVVARVGKPWVLSDSPLDNASRLIDCSSFGQSGSLTEAGDADASELAHVQFSSGSTGTPKGVRITHANALHNIDAIRRHGSFDASDVFVSWMPLTHDFGLVWYHLMPLVLGADQCLLPTQLFVRNPLLWIEMLSRHRGTVTSAPNSAYDRVCQAYRAQSAAAWDLSSVRFISNGAEPISPRIARQFLKTLAPHGLRENVMVFGYGLAEGTLAVAMTPPGESMTVYRLNRTRVSIGNRVDAALDGAESDLAEFVDVGVCVASVDVRTIAEDGSVLPERTIGGIEIRGASVTSGYFNDIEATSAAVSSGGWLNTGDIGFVDRGRLVITGRAKELIILNGVNYYPHDVEQIALAAGDLSLGKVAACGVRPHDAVSEELVLFVQHRGDLKTFLPLARALRVEVARRMGLVVARCVPVRRIPHTPSGKMQRAELARRFETGEYDGVLATLAALTAQEARAGRTRTRDVRATLAAAARAITGTETVDPHQPLFEQGFTSLRLVELVNQINDTFGTRHSISLVFEHPTLDAIAARLAVLDSQDEGLRSTRRRSDGAPVAVIGMACRFPGADSPSRFAQLLRESRDAVRALPPERWSGDAFGAFLGDVDAFDHRFFSITPIEARSVDPQQLMLLETSWEALEDAGIDASSLRGTRTGVFVGMANADYVEAEARSGRDELIGPYSFTGTAASVAAGRVAYVHGFHGPALAIDTACSSSLVAVHLAMQSLRSGESDAALAGGVSLMLSSATHRGLALTNALSADGRCKAFDDSADGYGRGEGCAWVMLKRLDDAERDGDRILAVLRGSAVNHDGASNGLTVPNGAAQEAVLRDALDDAALLPADIDFVEAHATGTPLGDPIEVQALARVHAGRSIPLLIGSVKSNIGHLEAAAGVAGLIKVISALQHETIPATLHVSTPNRHVDWESLPVAIARDAMPWPKGKRPRRAGVSAFGLSGTNAHLIVEEHHGAGTPTCEAPNALILPLSARSEESLRLLANEHAALLAGGTDARSLCGAASRRRTALRHRLAVTGHSAEDLARALPIARTSQAGEEPGIVFVYCGQGSVDIDAVRSLAASQSIVRDALERCMAITGLDLFDAPLEAPLQRAELAQPVIVAVGYALTELWRSWGIEPCAVVGHSIGEYAAAVAAGVMSIEDALHLALVRGRLMDALPEGAMLAVDVGDEIAAGYVVPGAEIAELNGPRQVTFSGTAEAIESIADACRRDGVRATRLGVARAAHSAMMEPILEELRVAASAVRYAPPVLPFISTATGGAIDTVDAAHWTDHVRRPVRFGQAIRALANERLFLEIGATSALSTRGEEILPDRTWLPAGCDPLAALAALFREGAAVRWSALHPDPAWHIALPNYPWQRDATRQSPAVTRIRTSSEAGSPSPAAPPPGPIVDGLRSMLRNATGLSSSDLQPDRSLISLGLDSLMLVRIRQAIVRHYGVDIELRDLYERLDTLAKIADHLSACGVRMETPGPIETPAAAPKTDVEALLSQQVEAMRELFARQLDVLQGATPKPTPKPAARRAEPAEVKGLYKKLDTTKPPQRSPEQRAHLARLIVDYTTRTRRSKEITSAQRVHLANSRSVIGFRREWKEMIYPLTVARAEGSKVWDLDGNEYVDITMGFGALLFGHAPQLVRDAVHDEMSLGAALGPQRPLAGEVAARIHRMTGVERVAFFTTGTEAVMVGTRVARAVTGRDKIVIFTNSYHGSFDGLLAAGWVDADGPSTVPIAAGTPESLVQDVIVLPYGDRKSLDVVRHHAGELAAVLVEPVQSRDPVVQPGEFLHALREITRSSGTALLFDEVILGFRCAPGGAQSWFGVEADLVTYGKVLGGGLPIGVLAGARRFMDAVDGGHWSYGDESVPENYTAFVAGTYNGHALAMSVANAVLAKLERDGGELQSRLNDRTARFCAELNTFFESAGVTIRAVHFSSLFRFVMSGDAELLNYHLLHNGVFVWEGRNCFLSTAHTDADIARVVDAVKRSVTAMLEDGWLPSPRPVAPRQVRLPLARSQQEMWFLLASEPEAAHAYREVLALELRGPLDIERLEAALHRVIARHPALRTMEIAENGQRIAPSIEIAVAPEAIDEPFDLKRGPFIRVALESAHSESATRNAQLSHRLLLTVHHLVADGWSLGVIATELLALYANPDAALPAATDPAEYLAWESSRTMAGRPVAPLLDEPFPPLEIPADRPWPSRRRYEGGRIHIRDAGALYERVQAFSRAGGVTTVTTFFAAYSALLARLGGESKFVIGVPYAGQLEMGAESLVGQCSMLLPVPVVIDDHDSFAAHLERTRATLIRTYEKTAALFSPADLQEVARIPRINAIFNMDRPVTLSAPNLELDILPVAITHAKFDLFLNIQEINGKPYIDVDYGRDLFDETTVARWIEQFFAFMREAMANPAESLRRLLDEHVPPRTGHRRIDTARVTAVAPRDAVESAIARVWSAALGLPDVGVTDDFLTLGGHSLKAVQIAARLESELGIRFTIRDLFEHPTIAQLAALAPVRRRAYAPISPVPPDVAYPASNAQIRLWMLDQLEPGMVAYNIPFAIHFDEAVDPAALRKAAAALARRHESLRTRFVSVDGIPSQIVEDEVAIVVGATEVASRDDAERAARALVAKPFDLSRAPLWRLHLLTHPGAATLVCNVHHIISDVWSLGIFVRELLALYRDEAATLAALPIQYRDFSAWQRSTVHRLDYWTEKLSGAAAMTYPTDFERPAAKRYRGDSVTFELEGDEAHAVIRFCRENGVSLFTVIAAAMTAQLHGLTGATDVTIGSVIAGREHPDVTSLIGFFVNNLVLRNEVRSDEPFSELLRRVRTTILEATEHADVPFDAVVEALRVRRDGSRHPLFDVVLVMDDRDDANAVAQEFGVAIDEIVTPTSQFDLTLYITDTRAGRIRFNAVFDTALYRRQTTQCWMDGLRQIIVDATGAAPAPRLVSYQQERLWFVDRFEAFSLYRAQPVYYNMAFALRLEAMPARSAIEEAVARVSRRHDALRMRIATDGDRPSLRLSGETPRVEIVEDPIAFVERPFDLANDVLWRAGIAGDELLIVAHHAIADDISLRIVAHEIAYGVPGEDVPQFVELARRQRSSRDEGIAADLPYWRGELAGLTALELPYDRPRAAVHIYRPADAEVALPPLPELGTSHEAALLALFQALLHRYSGQDDVVTGSLDRPGDRRCVGPLTDYVVIRGDFGGAPSLAELARSLDGKLAAAREHHQLAFDELVLQLKPKNDMSRTALFDVLFHYDGPRAANESAMNRGWGKFDLNLSLRDDGDGFSGLLTYNAELFDRDTIERMLRQFAHLAIMAADAPQRPLRDLPLLADAPPRNAVADYPRGATLHGLFERRASLAPQAIALTLGDCRLTYDELNARADVLARRLRARGVAADTLAGIYLDRSVELVVAVLAILKAGGAYVPLDPEYPAARTGFVIRDAGLRWVVTNALLAPELPDGDFDLVDIGAPEEPAPIPADWKASGPSSLCYVIYTSGSTGEPKGALIEHRNVVALLFHEGTPFDFGESDVWTLFHSPCFDFSVWEMYGALLFGGRLVIVPREIARDTAAFLSLIQRESVTILNQTPAAFYALAAEGAGRPRAELALRHVIFGGERLLPSKLQEWHARYPQSRLINMYGITETTVHVTFRDLDEADLASSRSVIGAPLPNVSAYIVDSQLRLQPVGVPGEILVGGHGVCRGYLNRPALTAERFLEHRFGGEGTLYRSGDVGYLRADGELIYLGRIDHQVKVRGYRIELGEIEAQLLSLESVREAVVVADDDGSGITQLHAYLVLENEIRTEELQGLLAERVPEYMVPSRFFRIDAVPLTENGKIDRSALAGTELSAGAGFVAPRNEREGALAAIWCEVLQRDRVGMLDNFFDLGGHSLKATQAVSRIRQRLQRDVSLKDFFSAPTLAALSDSVASRPRLDIGAIGPVVPAEHYDVSFAQRRLWIHHQLNPQSFAYNMVGAYRLSGALDVEALRAAFRDLVARHEILRTTFLSLRGEQRQIIAAPGDVPLARVDLRHDSDAVSAHIARETEHVFDLQRGPLLRARILHLPDDPDGESRHVLLVNLHHIVADGWSVAVILRELIALYDTHVRRTPPSLRHLPIQYKDYAAWQRAQWSGGRQGNTRSLLERFRDLPPPLDLRADRSRPPRPSGRGQMVTRVFDQSLSSAMRELARGERTTLFALALTAVEILLFRRSGQSDFVVGTPVAGRTHTDLESQVGFYLNLVPLRSRVSPAETARQLLQATASAVAAAFEHQDYPFDLFVEDLALGSDPSRHPLFDVLLILQNNEPIRLDLPGVVVEELPERSASSKVDLNFMIEDRPALELKLEFSTDLFDEETASSMAWELEEIAAALTSSPDATVREIADRIGHTDATEHVAFLASALNVGLADPEGW